MNRNTVWIEGFNEGLNPRRNSPAWASTNIHLFLHKINMGPEYNRQILLTPTIQGTNSSVPPKNL
jgi:hypothetical protein